MKYIILIFTLSLFLFACQKELELEIPEIEQKPVVSCIFKADTTFELFLSKTNSINDTLQNSIYDANCYLLQDNQIIDTLVFLNGKYISSIKAQQGQEYSLKISNPEFNDITATSYVPQQIEILNIEQQDFAVPDNTNMFDGDLKLPLNRLTFTFNDPANENNFYELKIIVKSSWNDSLNINPFQKPFIYSYNSVITNEDILDYQPKIFVFSDSLFNGQIKSIDFLYKQWWLQTSYGSEGKYYSYGDYRLYYQFRIISKEMYNYRKSLIKHVYNQQSDNFEQIGDPVQMSTNINNGYGIFAGYTEICDTIFVEKTFFSF